MRKSNICLIVVPKKEQKEKKQREAQNSAEKQEFSDRIILRPKQGKEEPD